MEFTYLIDSILTFSFSFTKQTLSSSICKLLSEYRSYVAVYNYYGDVFGIPNIICVLAWNFSETERIFNMDKTHPSNAKCSFLDVNLEQTKNSFIASILTSILNALFSLLTVSGNFIILRVIWKTQELHSPSFILLFCLAAADLLVGLICQPFFVAYQIAELTDNFSAYCILRMIQNISGWITTGVSFGTLSGVSIDRLLALTLHLRYNTIVTVQRILQAVCVLWIMSIAVVMLRFWIRPWIIFPFAVVVASFVVTTLSTLKIFQIIIQLHLVEYK